MSKFRSPEKKFLSPEVLARTTAMVLELSGDQGIDIAIAGGYAMQFYGSSRLTGDVDVIADSEPDEDPRLKRTKPLTFGGRQYVTPDGVEVDFIVRADAFAPLYQEALNHRVLTEDGIPVITPEYLAVVKFVAGRSKDHDDLMYLLQAESLVDRGAALDIVRRLLGAFAAEEFQSFIDEADWRFERDRKKGSK